MNHPYFQRQELLLPLQDVLLPDRGVLHHRRHHRGHHLRGAGRPQGRLRARPRHGWVDTSLAGVHCDYNVKTVNILRYLIYTLSFCAPSEFYDLLHFTYVMVKVKMDTTMHK